MNPVLVNVWRGSAIESRHRGAVAVVDSSGKSVFSFGDTQLPVYPRSAIKFFQSVPLLETGAAQHFDLDDQHIAFSCASHNGEIIHDDLANDWLKRIACEVDDLECGATLPMNKESAYELLGMGRGPQRTHHNCSGKHLGLLTTCRYLKETVQNYRLYHHPAQRRWFDVLENLCNVRPMQLPWGYDGCGIPTLAMPLHRVAFGMARFADKTGVDEDRAQAIDQIQTAVARHPYLVAGASRLCTALMERLAPKVLVKVGAEGFYAACLPEQGLGIAIKMDDGGTRGANVAMGAVLQSIGEMQDDIAAELQEFIAPSITNSRGEVVGRIEASSEWTDVSY
ncbi:MAG: asparaginase [Gammaproteobacteria bacterium]|nr:asparaginase [Gammaproteobacteria bacterium]